MHRMHRPTLAESILLILYSCQVSQTTCVASLAGASSVDVGLNLSGGICGRK